MLVETRLCCILSRISQVPLYSFPGYDISHLKIVTSLVWNTDFLRVKIMDIHPGHCLASDLQLQSVERELSTSIDVPGCDLKWLLGTCMSVSCHFPLQLIPWEEGKEGFEEGRGKLLLGLHFHHSL